MKVLSRIHRLYRRFPHPREWNTGQNPPYDCAYDQAVLCDIISNVSTMNTITDWMYHIFANLASLNQWRSERGFNTLLFRPHSGEAGDPNHLCSSYLVAHSIAHGILLRKLPALMYLFYLKQVCPTYSRRSHHGASLLN